MCVHVCVCVCVSVCVYVCVCMCVCVYVCQASYIELHVLGMQCMCDTEYYDIVC